MGTKLRDAYQEDIANKQLSEEETIAKIKEDSLKEYAEMKTKHKISLKTVLIIAGTMILIALIARAIYSTGRTADSNNNSNKKITNKVNIEVDDN